jgi:hypothetical protein
MKAEYDFSKGRRGQAVPTKGKTRITIYIDDQILAAFKAESVKKGIGYQRLIMRRLRSTSGLRKNRWQQAPGALLFGGIEAVEP